MQKRNWPSSARRTACWRERQEGKRVEVWLDPRMAAAVSCEAEKRGISRARLFASLIQYGWPVYGRRGL